MKLIESFFSKNEALKEPEFKYYLMIRFGLIFALSMQFTIVAYNVYHITNFNKLALGFVGLAEVIPVVGCSFFSGYFVDLREKRGLLRKVIIAYIFLGLGLFYLFQPHAHEVLGYELKIGLVYAFIFFGGIIRAFLGPTSFSLLGQLMPRRLYPNATSWSSMAFQIGTVLGPLVAGAIIANIGVGIGMGVVCVIELLLLIPISLISVKPILQVVREPVLKSIRQGLKFVFNTPALLGAQCLDMFSVLFGGAVALLPAIQQELFPASQAYFSGATAYGFLRAAPGIGSLITLGFLAFLPLKTKPGKKLFICMAGFGISIILFGFSKNFFLSWFMLVASGMFDAVSVVIRGTILQLVTPDEMRGRVSSVNSMFISSSNELGDFESGLMANWLGTVEAIVVGGCITLVVIAITYVKTPQLRKFSFKDYEKP